ncbi:hypothetical protein [Metapseudomonas resinovorans]|uniref:hypothetical protein n=1 Tax=Metapseudomonas resinovorans TaxID=53412 RepID=UPI001F275C36|nr:hypothetical protein [Pseudomonas resinovorans]
MVLTSVAAYPAWRYLHPVTAAEGWEYRLFSQGISIISALALDSQGTQFVSQEQPDRTGKILRLQADARGTEVLTGLSKPDGQMLFRDGRVETLFEADSVEAVVTDGHLLYAIEDGPQGRLLRYDPDTRQFTVLREGLDKGEGITICPDGRLFYTDKANGRVKQWQPAGQDPLVVEDLNAPGFVQCTKDGLWITEDATHGARLLLLDPSGRLEVILQHLRAPQTVIPLSSGRYHLAEHGRNRVLEIFRRPNGS